MSDDEPAPLAVAAVIPVSFLGIVAGGLATLVFAVTNDPSDAMSSLCTAILSGFTFNWHMQRYGYHPTSDSRLEDL